METTAPELQQKSESAKLSGLDLIVKYAVLLSWFVYGAGLTRMSGFLRTLGVPTEPSNYALPTVLSYGTDSLLEMLKIVAFPIWVLILFEKEAPRRLKQFIRWTVPTGLFVLQNYWLLRPIGPVQTRISYALYFLVAAYVFVYVFSSAKARESSVGTQLLVAAFLFFLMVEGAGYRGDLEANSAANNPPSVQFLLAPEAVPGAKKLGIPFSPSEPGLTMPLNVVAFSERMYYVHIPFGLEVSQVQTGNRLTIVPHPTIAIPRDKVIMASNHR
ncbi:MAG: hypothetical protein ACHQT6_09670 [Candidatus Acidiferrales bacterium]